MYVMATLWRVVITVVWMQWEFLDLRIMVLPGLITIITYQIYLCTAFRQIKTTQIASLLEQDIVFTAEEGAQLMSGMKRQKGC